MKIGIIGAGHMGEALGRLWLSKGHEVMFSFSRRPEQLKALSLIHEHACSGSVAEAIAFGEAIMIAVPYEELFPLLKQPEWFRQKIVITCVSGLRPDFSGETTGLPSGLRQSVAEELSAFLPAAHVVEAFNTTFAEVLQLPEREHRQPRACIFYCGDDRPSKQVVAGLIEDCGYEAVNAGSLRNARVLETLASSWVQFTVVSGLFPRIAVHAIQY